MASILSADNGSVSGSAGLKSSADSSGVLQFQTGANTAAVTIDASQNVGLGVTPSAWSTVLGLQVRNASVSDIGGTSNNSNFGSNWYYDGTNFKYISSNPATNFKHLNGAFQWLTAASGTAGSAITFTQAMTLDASGNLSIGTTAGGYRLLLSDGTVSAYYTPAASTMFLGTKTNHPLAFSTNDSERARIFNGGGISVFSATTANDTIDSCNNQAAGTTYSTFIGRHSATTIATGTVSCRIYTNGNIVNTNNSYGPISDIKLKENIVDATPKLQDLMRVRIVNYNLKTDQTHKQIGVIAQELEQVFAGLVDDHPDMDEQGNSLGTTTKSVKMSVFTPILIKAIQEQQALIESLTNRLTALEGKS